MLQGFHRGIYEYLWSEHKFVALGVSIRAFNNTASKLGTPAQCLKMLKKLQNYALAERPEHLSALLSAYMQIKQYLSRSEREDLIKTLLIDENAGAEKIYAAALRFSETTLYGCRLFFPECHAIYKFWDVQHHPGLWLCFGPFQLHLTPEQVLFRALAAKVFSHEEWVRTCTRLEKGMANAEFASLNASLKTVLLNNNMVAGAGNYFWLHPRAGFNYESMQIVEHTLDLQHFAGLILESFWDSAEAGQETLATLPELEDFKLHFEKLKSINSGHTCEEAFAFIQEAFNDLDSASGIGVETAYQEIHSEESEHGDDETEY